MDFRYDKILKTFIPLNNQFLPRKCQRVAPTLPYEETAPQRGNQKSHLLELLSISKHPHRMFPVP